MTATAQPGESVLLNSAKISSTLSSKALATGDWARLVSPHPTTQLSAVAAALGTIHRDIERLLLSMYLSSVQRVPAAPPRSDEEKVQTTLALVHPYRSQYYLFCTGIPSWSQNRSLLREANFFFFLPWPLPVQ